MKKSYIVAGHCFSVTADETVFRHMKQYEPFCTDETCSGLFSLNIQYADKPSVNYTEDHRQQIEEQENIYGHTEDGNYFFEFKLNDQTAGWLTSLKDFSEGTILLTGYQIRFAVTMALKLLFSYSTAPLNTVIIHASVVGWNGNAYMFIGKSGIGKSTHSRQWLQYISGTELVNDDNPVIRVGNNGEIRVYGSPWSGKTACYKNINFPLKGIVRIKQAPYNKIQRILGLDAFVMIRAHINTLSWDQTVTNGVFTTERILTKEIPIWLLECQPNEAAALLCHSEIA